MSTALAHKIVGPFVTSEVIETASGERGVSPETVGRAIALATRAEGFLGLETDRDDSGAPVTRTYWTDADKARVWSELTGARPLTREHGGRSPGAVRIDRLKDAVRSGLLPKPERLVIGPDGNHWE
jgi:heme-degrading monooxygenase HmoA